MKKKKVDINLDFDLIDKELKKRKGRSNLLDFITYTKSDYEVNQHHAAICQILDLFVSKKIRRLILQAPPRSGKSEIVSRRMPAYILGKNPHASIIATSYGSELSSMLNRDVQKVIDTPQYQELFPKTLLSRSNIRTVSQGSYLRNSDIFEVVDHKGTYRSAGVGGAITGMGGEFCIIDDPCKNMDEANSPTYRSKVWDWYTSVLYTRLEKNGSILLTLTRWHEDDLAGRLIEMARTTDQAEQWSVISFPAIKEDDSNPYDKREIGQPLWPNKYPMEEMTKMKISMGSRVWNSLYQQRPSASEGNIVQRSWLKYYQCLPAQFDDYVMSWDMAFKESQNSDYVVGQVWGRVGGEFYLIDQVRDRMNFPSTLQAFKAMVKKYPEIKTKLIEAKANGQAVIDSLCKQIYGIIPVIPQESKEARLAAISPLFEAGNVYLPGDAIWVHDFIEELVSFPNAKNDDSVDATSQALSHMSNVRQIPQMGLISLTAASKWKY
jgi:predicted phage terminase large subunit-like protein